jgi:mono/diheme cytochrome c family protein
MTIARFARKAVPTSFKLFQQAEGTTMRVKDVCAAVALIVWMGLVGAGPAAAEEAQDGAQIEHGIKVFADQKCGLCHSIAGKGNAKGPLDEVGSRLTADQIREWIVNPAEMTKRTKAERKPPMRAFPNLPAADLDAVVGYLSSLKKK